MRRSVLAFVVALASAAWVSSATAAPQITSVAPESGPTAGGTIITITGANFGAAGNAVLLGGRLCPITSQGPASIECTLPEGSGASRPIRVVDDLGTASPPYPFAYSPPAITQVSAASAPSAGGFPITIYGENFGAASSDRRVSVNGSAASSCTPDAATPHSQIVCTAPAGLGHEVPVDITVDGQRSPSSPFSYDPPAITSVTPTNGSPLGGTPITIYGRLFWDKTYTVDSVVCTAAAHVGSSVCPITEMTPDRIVCDLPPASAGAPTDVVVTLGCQDSNAVAFHYGLVASKCDAAKFKAAAGHAKCVATAEANAAKKGIDPSAEALAKCDDKMATACANAELKLSGCSQVGTCGDLILDTARKGWDGTIKGRIQ